MRVRASERSGGAPSPEAAVAVLAVLACLGAGLWFIRARDLPPSFDDAWYLEVASRLYHALGRGDLISFGRQYAEAFRFKAPLLSVLPLPFFALFGISLDAALGVNLAAMGFMSAYLYRFGAEAWGRRAGLGAVLAGLTLPLLFGLSRDLLTEYVLAAFVSAAAYHLWASEGLRREPHLRGLGAFLGLGLLTKVLFPLYLLGPAVEVLLRRRSALGGRFWAESERPFKVVLGIGGALALTWYGPNLIYVAGYVARASFGDIAGQTGSRRVFSPDVLLGYWSSLVDSAVSPFYVLAALGLLWALLRRGWRPARAWSEDAALRLVALWLVIPLAAGTLGVAKAIRFMAPALPAFALLLGYVLDRASRAWRFPRAGLAAFFLFPAFQFAYQTFGAFLLPPVRLGPLRLLAERTAQTGPPERAGQWRQEWLVDALAERAGGRDAVVALGVEHNHLNANNLSYFSARRAYPLRFVHYGYEESRVERAVARLREKEVGYLLFVDGIPERELRPGVKALDPQLRELVRSGRLPFRKVGDFALTPEITAALWERTGPIQLFGAPPPPGRPGS